jgi:hypothetical protein
MDQAVSKRLFITGIPTSGKSYLAEKLAHATDGIAVLLDDLRDAPTNDPCYKKWINFYFNQDEETYLTKTGPDQMWQNLVAQSEALWPIFIEKIKEYEREKRPVIFECVNLLPHLAKRDIAFPGICLLGSSYEETLARNKKDPRWGRSDYLQELEAKTFFYIERPRYKSEAEKYGYPVFESSDKALEYALKVLTVT